MSDSIRGENLQVDPRLDALLSRALGRGTLPRQQRQRHLERLGLASRLGGSASIWRAPVVSGRPPSHTAAQPVTPPIRRRRQWLELGAAVLAVVLVGSLLVALFRDWEGGEDNQQLAASPEATEETVIPSPTTEPTAHELLFATSQTVGAISSNDDSGRVTAFDAQTGNLVYAIETRVYPDAVLSSDGTRLFILSGGVISSGGTTDTTLQMVNAATGAERWSAKVENRVLWTDGEGPTTLAVSYDGSRLFVYSAGESDGYTIQVFDTEDGELVRTIEGVAGCAAQLFLSADGRSLYVVCMAEASAPQVIDLDTMTVAGVMQGFGGAISGAAASPDGRDLYITHDVDGVLRLTVVDMNARAVVNQRDIVLMGGDALHSLNLTAISPDGARLFVGIGSQSGGESPVGTQVWVWDISALQNGSGKIAAPAAIDGWSLAAGPDNRSVFAIRNERGATPGNETRSSSTIVRLSTENGSEPFVTRPDWQVLRLFSGRVTDSPPPPTTDEPESALSDLTVPDELPRMMTLSTRQTTAPESERLLFNGTDGLVVQIDVRRWTDGEALDPPDRSTPIQIGGLTVHVTPEPNGGWPRTALWRDQRFVYSLSILSYPPGGWTRDDLLALVTAFSSPASAGVCPTTPWTGPENRNVNGLPEAYWIDGDGLALGQAEGRLVEGVNQATFVTAPNNKLVDPDPSARVTISGTRLFTGYERAIPLEMRDQTIDWNVPAGTLVRVQIRSTLIFPTFGCWQIEAKFGGNTLRAVVNVEPDVSVREPASIWETLRWRPLYALPSESSPPCERTPARQVIGDFGPLASDTATNGGPVYLNGPDVEGVIPIPDVPADDGGYYARVMFVTGGDYTGPMLARAAAGSAPIGFSIAAPDATPAGEWQLQDPAGTSPTAGVRHWIVYLRLSGPGCYALQIDGLDFTSVIAFEAVAEDGS